MSVLPIALTMTAAAALLNLWIAIRVGTVRRQHSISIGDGGNEALIARMRAHANFIENTPIFLILLGLIELAEGSALWLWVVGIVYILARICHALGMDRLTGASPLRGIGVGLSMLSTLILTVYALSIPYRHRATNPVVTYVAADPLPASTLSATNGLVRRS